MVLCLLYGAGALLIREVARGLQAGWPTIALFAAAYALVEEGLVDQMVFNPGYLGYQSFAGRGEIPGLGISGTLLRTSLALHTVWSICVSGCHHGVVRPKIRRAVAGPSRAW